MVTMPALNSVEVMYFLVIMQFNGLSIILEIRRTMIKKLEKKSILREFYTISLFKHLVFVDVLSNELKGVLEKLLRDTN